MQQRFALRFESGERRGETIAIPDGGLTLGRRPGNSVQVLDASVSGKHAQVVVDDRGALVRDLGSTNGTRVGEERISEKRLAHGDVVFVGAVKLLFLDTAVDASPPPTPATAAPAADAGQAGESVRTISADKVNLAGKRSMIGVAALVLIAGGAAAWWWFRGRSSGEGAAPSRSVVAVPGNLLAASFSFESDASAGAANGWQPDETVEGRFQPDPAARVSGEWGLRAALSSGETARQLSPSLTVSPGQPLRAQGSASVDGDGRAAMAVELSSSQSGAGAIWARTPDAGQADAGFEDVRLEAIVPPGYDRARVAIEGRAISAAGSVSFDDVALLSAGEPAAASKVGEFQWTTLGALGVLTKIDQVLASDWRASRGDAPIAVRGSVEANGFRLELSGQADALTFRVETAALAQGLATLGSGGYRTHQIEFEREGVDGVLFGSGLSLVRVALGAPARVQGAPEGNAFRITARFDAVPSPFVQVAFRDERNAAEDSARLARAAEKEGRLGDSLAAWGEMLDRAPFEAALVQEAETARSRLIQRGLEEVRAASAEVGRARFFRLADLYRQCRRDAEAIAARYAASEVEAAALELVREIDVELAGLDKDLARSERDKLAAILRTLEAREMPRLAARVRETLARMEPEGTR